MPAAFKHQAGTYVAISSDHRLDDVINNLEPPVNNEDDNNDAAGLLRKVRDGRRADIAFWWPDHDSRDEVLSRDSENDNEEEDSEEAKAIFDGSATLDLIRGSSTTTAAESTFVATSQNGCVETVSGLLSGATVVSEDECLASDTVGRRQPTVTRNDGGDKASPSTSVTGARSVVAAPGRLHSRSLSVQQ
jgi:hypothetical protein